MLRAVLRKIPIFRCRWKRILAIRSERFFANEATFEVKPFKLHRLKVTPETKVSISKEEATKLFTQMETIRRMETAGANLYKEKIVRGFCHLYSGQEACAVGMKSVMREQDCIITAYRSHGWTYLMGVTPLGVLAELAGREQGCARGKGGSMHMYATNFFGGNGIVGAQVPVGTGIALACKYKENKGVCFTIYGDGAANQGQVAEAQNIACLLKLPCIFVCENNGFGMGTSAVRSSCNTDYYTRGDLIPGIWVDGMDVLAVKSATKLAIDCAVNCGPVVLELATYRYYGHSMSDPGTSYRSRDEIQEVRQKRDPITSFKEKIIQADLLTAEEVKNIEREIKKDIEAASETAKADKEIQMDELWTDVYASNVDSKIRNIIGFTVEHKTRGSVIQKMTTTEDKKFAASADGGSENNISEMKIENEERKAK